MDSVEQIDGLDDACSRGNLWDVYTTVAARHGDVEAILAPGRQALRFAELPDRVAAAKSALGRIGIGRGDRVAIALPNGPDAAVCYLAVLAAATAIGLNPAHTEDEFRAYLSLTNAKAVIVPAGRPDAVCRAARDAGAAIIELVADASAPAGTFALVGDAGEPCADRGWNGRDDIGLIVFTSGSTAQPKMVPSRLRHLISHAADMRRRYALGPEDRALHVMPLFHGQGLRAALLGPICAGSSVVCLPTFDLDEFFAALATFRPTWYTAAYTIHRAVLDHARRQPEVARAARLRFIRSGSGKLDLDVLHGLEEAFGAPVIERYGQSETGTLTANPLPPGMRKPGTVGVATVDEIAILGDDGGFLPPEAEGEIVSRGPTVFDGYIDDPAGNAGTFVRGWFRTGDIGRIDRDGYLTITGRLKDIINRGGEKISPGEVEHALAQHPAVSAACAFGIPHPSLGEEVGAVVVLKPGMTATAPAVAAAAATTIAAFKVPRRIVVLDDLPLGASGKIDRPAARRAYLAAPPSTAAGDVVARRSADAVEAALAPLWASVLKRDAVPRDEDFFLLGGDSLAAGQLLTQVHRAFGVALPLGSIFDATRTLALMAAAIARGGAGAAAAGQAGEAPEAIVPGPGSGPVPLSLAQEQLWLFDQMQPGASTYNVNRVARIRGPLDVAALERALNALVARHDSLRTTFAADGGVPHQVVHPTLRVALPAAEIAAPPGPACEAEIARIVGETINRPFDLARGPLIRADVWRIAADDHLLILSLHHILVDGSAIDILSEELAHFYDAFAHGRAAPLPPLPCRFADYVLWERAACEGPAAAAHRAYWTANLAGAPPAVALPGTGHRPPRGAAGARHRHTYPEDLLAGLKRLARIERTTLYPTLLAALNVLLGRYAGQDDVVVGAPVSARSRPELRGMVGMMINVLPIRTDLSGDPSFRTLLARVTRTILGAIAHRDLPVQRVIDTWGVRPADGRPPFTITVVMTSAGTFAQRLPGLDVELAVADDGTTKFDVNFVFYEEDGRLVLAMQYDTGLFDAPTMQRIAGQFGVLLHAIVRRPDDPLSALPMMTEDERRVLLDAWSGADRCRPVADSIVSSFARQVRERPDAAAVVCGERRVSYAALDAWSAAIARRLGAPAGATIAIAARRSPAMIAGLLGILRSGGAYLAIDPDWPADRLRFVLADSGAAVMLAEPGLVDGDPGPPVVALDDIAGAGGPDAPPPPVGPDAIAYVAYTSGSTGKPKGIAVPHAGVVRLVRDTDYAAFGPTERVLQAAPLAFDASTFEIWGAILNGGCLVQVPEEPAGPAEIARAVVGGGATTVWLTAALFNQMVDHHPACFAAVRQVVSGGEAMSVAHARRFRAAAPHCRLVNGYGPTENTTFTAAHTVSPADENAAAVPIGRPIANTRVYVLDPHMQPVAVGAPGELHIGGAGLARGYVGQPDLTAAQFVADPFVPGERLYRSGDRVRWRADGTLDFLGRLDRQVKLAGHRIEPGEIEATLVEHPSVLQAAVVAQGDGDRRRLVAYCVRAPHRGDPSLEDFLRSRLPAYLRPAVVVDVPALPLTANGKLDLDALAAQGTMSHRERRGHVAPRDELEARLATLWADLLGRDRVGVHDDFFDLGGHSLLAAKLFALIDREMEHPLPLATIFDAPTVGALAAVIRVGRRTKAWPTAVPITEAGAHAPLFAVPGVGGNVVGFAELARRLEPAVPLIGLQARGLDGNGAPFTRLEDIAAYNIGEMRARQPAGPYAIFGACIGGVIAYEIAQQLVSAGETVAALVLLDPSFRVPRPASWHLQAGHRLRHAFELPRYLAARAALYAGEMRSQPKAAWPDYLRGKADALGAMLSARRLSTGVRREIHQRRVIEANRTALESYVPRPYPGRIHIFRSADRVHRPLPRRLDWTALAAGAVAVEAVPGRDSGDALREPNVATLAALLRRHLDGLPH